MNFNCDESHNLLPLDLCQIATNHLREFVQHRDLWEKVDVSHDSDKSGGGGEEVGCKWLRMWGINVASIFLTTPRLDRTLTSDLSEMSLEKRHILLDCIAFRLSDKNPSNHKEKKRRIKHKQTVWSTEDAIKELEITKRNSHLLLFQTLQSFLVSSFFSAGQRFRAITCPLHLTWSYGQLWQISKEPHYQRSKHFFRVHGKEGKLWD